MRIRCPLILISTTPLVIMQLVLLGCPPGAGISPEFNLPPTVLLTADVTRGIAPLTVNFDSAGSSDDGLIVSRRWDFGDGQTSPDISPSHTFRSTGVYTVQLTLTDDDGDQTTRSIEITVTQAPIAVITVDRTSAESAPAVFNFDASASSDPDGTIEHYQWDFGDGSRELVSQIAHTFATPGTYRVRLTVTDNTGVTGSTDRTIQVGIPVPRITFRDPPNDVANVVVSPDSPLWTYVVYDVQPGVPHMIRAGLDGDRDPCEAQAAEYDAESGELLQRYTRHADRVTAVAYLPQGLRVVTAGEDATVRMYNAESGELWRDPDTDAAPAITSLAVSPNGTRYVYGTTDGTVVVRDVASGELVRQFAAHTGAVNAVAFSRDVVGDIDGTRVASGGSDTVAIVYDVTTGATLQVLDGVLPDGTATGHELALTSVAFSPISSDIVLTGSLDETAKLWRVQDGVVLRTFAGDDIDIGFVNAVAFSPDAQFVLTGSADNQARVWDRSADGVVVRTFSGHEAPLAAVAYSPDGQQLLTGSEDGTAILWEVATGDAVRRMEPCASTISSVAFSPDQARLLLGVGARSDVQLDTDPPQGNDINLKIPTALDLSVLPSARGAQYPGEYYLWAELDTDRTGPVRAYAAGRVYVVRPFTETVDPATPLARMIPNAAGREVAVVVVAPRTTRQIFDLGPLRQGDRLYLSLLTTPGYGEFYEDDTFSVMVLDADENVFAWYQDGFILFSKDAKLIIGHDSPNYYVVIDGCRPPTCARTALGHSVSVGIERGVGQFSRKQRIFLDFDGGTNITINGLVPFDLPPLRAVDLNPAWGDNETQDIKNAIVARMELLYDAYNVEILTSDDATTPAQPYQTLYFGGTSPFLYGLSSYIDPRNETLTGDAVVATAAIAADYPFLDPGGMGMAIGNVAAHEAGHLLGLRHTQDEANDVMGIATPVDLASQKLMSAPLYKGEQYNAQIGIQDADQLFSEIIGPRP